MGQQRAILLDLKRRGIKKKDRTVVMHAVEELFAAGDVFSDIIFEWTDRDVSRQDTISAMERQIDVLGQAVKTIKKSKGNS